MSRARHINLSLAWTCWTDQNTCKRPSRWLPLLFNLLQPSKHLPRTSYPLFLSYIKKEKNGTDHTLFRSDTTHLVCWPFLSTLYFSYSSISLNKWFIFGRVKLWLVYFWIWLQLVEKLMKVVTFFFKKKTTLIYHKDDCKVYYLSLAGNALAVSRKAWARLWTVWREKTNSIGGINKQ